MSKLNLELFSSESSDSESEELYDNKVRNLPWIEKYRPNTLKEVASHKDIMNILKVFIKSPSLPHILFYGPPGTGKTSAIQAYAKELYGGSYRFMVMEINASEDRGIDSVRNKIKQFVNSDCSFQKITKRKTDINFKLVILDEIDAMTDDAQSILRHVIDNYTKNARFCLVCNYIKKIDQALQSRCTPFRFSPIQSKDMRIIIKRVIKKEGVKITRTGVECLIARSGGDLRKMLNFLQSANMIYPKINEDNLNRCFGYPQKKIVTDITYHLLNSDMTECYKSVKHLLKSEGLSLSDIITELFNIINNNILDRDDRVSKAISKDYKNALIPSELSMDTCSKIIRNLRCIEINQSTNSTDYLQIGGLISSFKMCLLSKN